MVNIKDVKTEIREKAKWYLTYRTQLWAGIFLLVGLVGGNVDRVRSFFPTLKYDTDTVTQKLEQLDAMSDKLIKIQETLDKLNAK
jgi:hypothetical protein